MRQLCLTDEVSRNITKHHDHHPTHVSQVRDHLLRRRQKATVVEIDDIRRRSVIQHHFLDQLSKCEQMTRLILSYILCELGLLPVIVHEVVEGNLVFKDPTDTVNRADNDDINVAFVKELEIVFVHNDFDQNMPSLEFERIGDVNLMRGQVMTV